MCTTLVWPIGSSSNDFPDYFGNLKHKKAQTYTSLGFGAPCRDRTSDLLITSQLLYQLS
jgi:hypothetical protein